MAAFWGWLEDNAFPGLSKLGHPLKQGDPGDSCAVPLQKVSGERLTGDSGTGGLARVPKWGPAKGKRLSRVRD